ncbi:9014_t:CDS:2 [Ambispora gerdemannii]|uniref:9014_t:CDS:1 n=1 Tax=Ambispora gerdemannii TaxID=144530 RepID=A0A9N8W3Y0_9GLOM|nr:9014_t:CDS:2 [Ambispora gerdemannii]
MYRYRDMCYISTPLLNVFLSLTLWQHQEKKTYLLNSIGMLALQPGHKDCGCRTRVTQVSTTSSSSWYTQVTTHLHSITPPAISARADCNKAQGRRDAGSRSKKAEDGGINEKPEGAGVSKCKAEGPNEEMDGVCQAAHNKDNFASLTHFRDLCQQRIDVTWVFMTKVLYNVLDEAIKEAIQSRDLVLSKNQETRAAGQQPYHQTITIRKQNCVDNLRFYPRILSQKDESIMIPNLCGININSSGHSFGFMRTSHENQVRGLHICSLGPGVRTFMTWYSPMW